MGTIRRTALTAVAALLTAGAVFAGPQPTGDEMTLHAAGHDRVHRPAIAVAADGTLWSVWQSDSSGIVGRRFGADFAPASPADRLAGNRWPDQVPYRGPALMREAPVVVPLADGRLFVAWREQNLDLNVDIFYQKSEVVSTTLAGRLFAPNGRPSSRQFVIAEGDGDSLGQPVALAVAERQIVVAWTALDAAGDSTGIDARVLRPNGSSLTPVFRLDDRSIGSRPALALASDGGFLAVWQEAEDSVFARTFDADGTPRGSAVTVRAGGASLPVVARGADGGYLVAWLGPVSEPGLGDLETRLYGRPLDAGGLPDGPALALSSGGGVFHGSPGVAAGSDGYLVAWSIWNRSAPLSIRAVPVDPSGRPAADSYRLNQNPINYMWKLAIAADSEGRFLVAWEGFNDAGESAVNARQVTGVAKSMALCVTGRVGTGACDR